MTTSKTFDESMEPGLTNQINASVEKGAIKIDTFEKQMKKLIQTLKKQHDSMVAFSDARLEVSFTCMYEFMYIWC